MSDLFKSGKDDKIVSSLGVLLWSVARADGKIKNEEVEEMRRHLQTLGLNAQEIDDALVYTKKLEEERIDIFSFVRKIAHELDYQDKVTLVKELFAVAFSDKNLVVEELEIVRKIANIFYLSHKDFIQAKLDAQRKAGLKTLDF